MKRRKKEEAQDYGVCMESRWITIEQNHKRINGRTEDSAENGSTVNGKP
jgi:hypothetical protein